MAPSTINSNSAILSSAKLTQSKDKTGKTMKNDECIQTCLKPIEVHMTELFLYLSKVINGGNKDVIVRGVINPDWVRTGYLKGVSVTTTPVCAQLFYYKTGLKCYFIHRNTEYSIPIGSPYVMTVAKNYHNSEKILKFLAVIV
jgi:hypothetical protein